jgi:hypothetical protein
VPSRHQHFFPLRPFPLKSQLSTTSTEAFETTFLLSIMPFRMASAFFLSLFWSTSFVLGHIAADAPAVVTLYTAFLDPLPEQVSGFSVKYFKLRTMHALVDKANSLKSTSVRVIHVEIPGHDDMIKR